MSTVISRPMFCECHKPVTHKPLPGLLCSGNSFECKECDISWIMLDAAPPRIPSRCSDLNAFIDDVTNRYPVKEIYLFGSRANRNHWPKPTNDWQILVIVESGAEIFVNDASLQRHFGEYLDLFAMDADKPGCWNYPAWTTIAGLRGWWFPRQLMKETMKKVHPKGAA